MAGDDYGLPPTGLHLSNDRVMSRLTIVASIVVAVLFVVLILIVIE